MFVMAYIFVRMDDIIVVCPKIDGIIGIWHRIGGIIGDCDGTCLCENG